VEIDEFVDFTENSIMAMLSPYNNNNKAIPVTGLGGL
jgi:hypothetical protein